MTMARDNACKGAKIDVERGTILKCQLCTPGTSSAQDGYDRIFNCQYPLLCEAGRDSDHFKQPFPLATDHNCPLLPAHLTILHSKDRLRSVADGKDCLKWSDLRMA